MDSVEKAIRNAFEKGDAGDRAYREKVYRSAFAALERHLRGRPELSAESARARRESLKASVTQIESEFVPARRTNAADGASGEDADALSRPSGEADARRHAGEPAPASMAEPEPAFRPDGAGGGRYDSEQAAPWPDEDRSVDVAGAQRDAEDVVADEREPWQVDRRPGRGRRVLGSAVIVVLLVAVGAGAWWIAGGFVSSGPSPGETAPKTVDDILQQDSSAPETTNGAASGQTETVSPQGNGITVFSPSDAAAIDTPAGASADIMEGEDFSFLRIGSPDARTAISFDIGQGALESLAGGKVVFNIVARAPEGTETEMSISCDFGDMGDCGRKRYVVNATRSENLLDVDLGGGVPRGGGSIAIVPDIAGKGRALDLYEIRATRASE